MKHNSEVDVLKPLKSYILSVFREVGILRFRDGFQSPPHHFGGFWMRSCRKDDTYIKWCEALSSVSLSGGPEGQNPRFQHSRCIQRSFSNIFQILMTLVHTLANGVFSKILSYRLVSSAVSPV